MDVDLANKKYLAFENENLMFLIQFTKVSPFFPEHSAPINVDLANKKYLARTEEFWDTLHNTGWWQYEEPEVQTKKSSKQQAINGEKK